MSDTKWREMFGALSLLRRQISFDCRVKLLNSPKPHDWRAFLPSYTTHDKQDGSQAIWIEPSGGPVSILVLEWIEIKPTDLTQSEIGWTKMPQGYQNQIEQQLDVLQVPYTLEGKVIRVTGHVRRQAVK